MKTILLFFLIGCGNDITETTLPKEFYEWQCRYQTESDPIDKVHVFTNTCDDVTWITGEVHLYDGEIMARTLVKDTLSIECEWTAEYPLINDYSCESVEGVVVKAWTK